MADDAPSLPTATWIDSVAQAADEAETQRHPALTRGHRYDDLGHLAKGGMGQVRRVHDRLLGRPAVMKIMHARLAHRPKSRLRFLNEVRITARLQHPGIAPVQEAGEFIDGRLWFVMKEIAGRTLHSIARELHQVMRLGFDETRDGWTMRRLIEVLHRVAQTVAYAHGQGIIHRDLKPENLMVGAFGEVMVMDWGIAYDGSAERHALSPNWWAGEDTGIVGTPSYMAPEQARGEVPTPATDVYALGGVLYHLLAGRKPIETPGDPRKNVHLRPPPLSEVTPEGFDPPPALAALCGRAMQFDPADRLADAATFASALRQWLEGEAARARARELVERTRDLVPRAAALMTEADALDDRSRAVLSGLAPTAPIADKRPGWQLADDAIEKRREARRTALAVAQTLRQALEADPTYAEARDLLSEHYRTQVLEAERRGRTEVAEDAAEALRLHDPSGQAEWLRGDGALTLITDPPGATAVLYRYAVRDRRRVPVEVGPLPKTPIVRHALPPGSYAVELRAEGRAPVTYPVYITRGHHWDGIAPGEREARIIPLPKVDDLGPDDCYVPAGWALIGGDEEATDPLPGQRSWVDGFVMKRHPVTHGAYLAYLDHLVARSQTDLAAMRVPMVGPGEGPLYALEPDGRYSIRPAAGIEWHADMPVMRITWTAAAAYAEWIAHTTGQRWQMPDEVEWEKAARGADGRRYVMGDFLDPTWACVLSSHTGRPAPTLVSDYPIDCSPYGIRGLTGNAQDYCRTTYRVDDPSYRIVRGGWFIVSGAHAGGASRYAVRPDALSPTASIRLTRPL